MGFFLISVYSYAGLMTGSRGQCIYFNFHTSNFFLFVTGVSLTRGLTVGDMQPFKQAFLGHSRRLAWNIGSPTIPMNCSRSLTGEHSELTVRAVWMAWTSCLVKHRLPGARKNLLMSHVGIGYIVCIPSSALQAEHSPNAPQPIILFISLLLIIQLVH